MSRTKPSDTTLIRRCRRGDRQAWETLISRYERLVYAMPRRYGLSTAECDDVFQSTWLALLRRLDQIDDPERIAAWLATTARREAWNRRRGGEHTRTFATAPESLPEPPSADRPTPEQLVVEHEQTAALQDGLDQLSDRCQTLLSLLYFSPEAPSYAAIADMLSMPVGAVGPTRARCLARLRRLLSP